MNRPHVSRAGPSILLSLAQAHLGAFVPITFLLSLLFYPMRLSCPSQDTKGHTFRASLPLPSAICSQGPCPPPRTLLPRRPPGSPLPGLKVPPPRAGLHPLTGRSPSGWGWFFTPSLSLGVSLTCRLVRASCTRAGPCSHLSLHLSLRHGTQGPVSGESWWSWEWVEDRREDWKGG